MAYYRFNYGGFPSDIYEDMNEVLNEKFETSIDYPTAVWAEDVNLLGELPTRTVSGATVTISDGAPDVAIKSGVLPFPGGLSKDDPTPQDPAVLKTPDVVLTQETGGETTEYRFNVQNFAGGNLNPATGEVEETWDHIELKDLTWTKVNSTLLNPAHFVATVPNKVNGLQNLNCTTYRKGGQTLNNLIRGSENSAEVTVYDGTFVDKTAAYFKNHVTGTLYFESSTYSNDGQTTPQVIKTKAGENTFRQNQGNITLTYHVPLN